jgi:hypothetical protein
MAPLDEVLLPKCIIRKLKFDSLQMANRFMKSLIFLLKILKDNKDFFHECKYDEHHEI